MNGKGLFIDLDGSLANSLAALREAYFSFLARLGAKGSEAEFQRLNGPPLAKIVEMLKETHNLPGDLIELKGFYSAMIRQANESAPAAKGAGELLVYAQRTGWKVAVVTSSPRLLALEWLKRTGLSRQVDAVVGGDEVAAGKPSPAPYALAVSRVRCTVAESLAVEDSRVGAISAVSAGLSTWALADPRDRSDWPPEVRFITGLPELKKML